MARSFDLYEDIEEETAGEKPAKKEGGRTLYLGKSDPSEAKRASALIKKVRNKNILKSMENPFEDDQELMEYLDRAIDNSRSPLDQLELKMLHENLCREIRQEKFQKKTKP